MKMNKDDSVIRLVTVMLAGVAGYTFSSGLHGQNMGSIITGLVMFLGAALASYYIRV